MVDLRTLGDARDQVNDVVNQVLASPVVWVCPTHNSPWYEDEGMCQRAAAATAWKEDDTMWLDCETVVAVALVRLDLEP